MSQRAQVSLSGITSSTPSAFAQRLLAAGAVTATKDGHVSVADGLSSAVFSLRGSPDIRYPDLALLAVIIRALAEGGTAVRVVWPAQYRGRPSRLSYFLERSGFRSLLLHESSVDDWRALVKLDAPAIDMPPRWAPRKSYIPFQWIDKDTFDFDLKADYFKAWPRVREPVRSEFASLLRTRGFFDEVGIGVVIDTIFLELGWNIVLHSGPCAGKGYGVFGAMVPEDEPSRTRRSVSKLSFCVADAGAGVPATLAVAYDEYCKKHERLEYQLQCSRQSAIVRYALQENASRRTDYMSPGHRSGARGLSLVSASIGDRGQLTLRSDGGVVDMRGIPGGRCQPSISPASNEPALPGTQVVGRLVAGAGQARATAATRRDRPDAPVRVLQVCDANGEIGVASVRAAWERVSRTPQVGTDLHLVDLGYHHADVHRLDDLAPWLAKISRLLPVIFWGLRVDWSLLNSLARCWSREGGGPAAFSRGTDSLALLVTVQQALAVAPGEPDAVRTLRDLWQRSADWDTENERREFRPLSVDVDATLALTRLSNNLFLRRGFNALSEREGFFRGRVHLLGGRAVPDFFSLSPNINAPGGANRARWETTAWTVVMMLLSEVPASKTPIRIIALGLPAIDLLPAILRSQARAVTGHAITTYGAPNPEELATIVKHGETTVLLCDVVSTGSLVTDVARIVAKLGASVAGVCTLVDARGVESKRFTRFDLRIISGSRLPTPDELPPLARKSDFYVDPISLVPSEQRTFGIEVTPDFNESIEFIANSRAVRCGHAIDGTRHMSTYIDLALLIDDAHDFVVERVRTIARERSAVVGWRDFSPSIIIHPKGGISRVESLTESSGEVQGVSVYRSAVTRYNSVLKGVWPKCEQLEVPRAFDPGGRPRCARVVDTQRLTAESYADVVVVDDGLWTGRTALALARLAVATLSAKRVLVLPLLARVRVEERTTWYDWRAISAEDGEFPAQICFAFPFVLPIESYASGNCPYERAISQIEGATVRMGAGESLGAALLASLTGRPPLAVENPDGVCTGTWLRVRAYAELAEEDEDALERLVALLENADSDLSKSAIVTLFLHEAHLLQRPGLRKVVEPMVRRLCIREACSSEATQRLRIEALSLLRAHFVEDFVETLSRLPPAVRTDRDSLERMVLHFATLPRAILVRPACRDYLAEVVASLLTDAEMVSGDITEDGGALIGGFERLLSSSRVPVEPSNVLSAAEAIERLLTKDFGLVHETKPTLDLIDMDSEFVENNAESFREISAAWEADRERIFEKRLSPYLGHLHGALTAAEGGAGHIVSTGVEYLTKDTGGGTGVLADVSTLSYAFKALAAGIGRTVLGKALVSPARRLLEHVVAERSTLLGLIAKMRGPSLESIAGTIVEKLQALPSSEVDVELEHMDGRDRSLFTFLPSHYVRDCVAYVVENVRKHGFGASAAGVKRRRVLIKVTVRREDDGSRVGSVLVRNNGTRLESPTPLGPRARATVAELGIFGAALLPPNPVRDGDWAAEYGFEVACHWQPQDARVS